MDLIYKNIDKKNEDEIIQELTSFLKNGGAIDSLFLQKNVCNEEYLGTILHYSVDSRKQRVVEYVLTNGANIAVERTSSVAPLKYQNALELAAERYDTDECSVCDNNGDDTTDDEHFCKDPTFEIVKKRSLELYSSYGLTPFHINCAIEIQYCSDETEQYLKNTDVNAAVSTESPLWPGMTPILIAAKFENEELVKRLLDLGADPCARDSGGNTPLHYLFPSYSYFYDARLFALEAKNTFGSFTGESHFHIACRNNKVDIVKRYLDQGISPDLPIKGHGLKDDTDAGKTGLHLAVEIGAPELVELLLEYGADLNKEDSKGHSPIDNFICTSEDDPDEDIVKCICLLIEVGAQMLKEYETKNFQDELSEFVSNIDEECKRELFSSIKKLTMLNEDLVPQKLSDIYDCFAFDEDEWNDNMYDWNDFSYGRECLEELESLPDLSLLRILEERIIVKPDFAEKYKWLESFNFESYPIYGNMLKIKSKRILFELKEKKRKIAQAVRKVQWLFQSQGRLPQLCADMILRNLSDKELDQFLAQ